MATRDERARAVEAMADTGRTGANGLYTPEMVEKMEPSKIAATMNSYVERLNVDVIQEAKRKARNAAFFIFLFGGFVGGLLVYFMLMAWFNPVRELLQHLPK